MATHTREFKGFEIAVLSETTAEGRFSIGWSVTPKAEDAKVRMSPGRIFSSLPTLEHGSEPEGIAHAFGLAEQWVEGLSDH
jgi:dTDP-glucose pyrophosphorylase